MSSKCIVIVIVDDDMSQCNATDSPLESISPSNLHICNFIISVPINVEVYVT